MRRVIKIEGWGCGKKEKEKRRSERKGSKKMGREE